MIKKSVLISCIFLTLLWSESSLGQAKKFVAYEVESGLSSDYLNVIFQDSKGFIWAGTNNGLNRFDGYQFKVFNNIENDSTSLSNNWITSILEDSNGTLWIGTEGGGLNQYNSNSGKFRRFQHSDTDPTSISSNMVIGLHEDSQGRLWVGTQEGLNLMNKEGFTFKNWSNYNNCDECNHAISSIEGDYKGNLWIGDETYGLYYFNVTTETFSQSYEAIDSKSGSLSFVNDLLLDNNHLWIGTANGPYRMNLSNNKIAKFDLVSNKSNEIFNDFVIRIRKDQRGEIWICTEGSGVAAYDENNQRFEVYKSEKNSNLGLTSNAVADVVVDYSDNLWVATRGGGINKLDLKNRIFEHFESQPSPTGTLVNSEVRALLQEQDGTIWIGTNKGLSRYNRKNNRFKNYVKDFKFKSDVSAPRIRLIHRSKNNDLWVSSQSGGLYKYNSIEDRFILDQVYSNNTLSNNARKISYIYEKSDDLLWLFTDGTGIIQYNLKTRKIQQILSKSTDNNLSKLAIYCVEVHTDGQLWMGTDDGLFLFDTNTLQHQVWKKIIGDPNSLADNKIRSLYKDEESNNLWIGTRNGLSKYNFASEQFSLFREEDGLASNVVFGILPAPNNQLIFTTPKGLSRFNTKTEEFKNTAIPQNESLDMGGHAVGLNGELIVGGPDGFSIFHPKDLNDNPYIPKIVLTNFKVNNENANLNIDVSQLASIELDYDQNDLVFEFAALEFTKPKNNQYEYFLEGYNEEWIEHGNKHDVTFTNLNPGDYVFRIRGSNNDGIWNEEGVSLSIKISRPFWTTWWFRAIGILIILSGILYYNRWKAGRIRANKLELNNKIDEETAKVNAQNSELISQKEKLLHTIEEIKHIVKEAGESGNFKIRIDLEDKQDEWRDLAKSINEMFDSISKPFNEINHIVNQMALGDLTLRYSENAQGDVKELANNLNKSLDIIVDLLTDISNQVDTIRLSSDDMLMTTQEINISTGEIAMSISEMSDGANRQVIRIDESSNLLEGILKFSNEMKEQAKSIDDATISGVDKCLAGIEYINNLDKEMKKILEFSAKTDDSIQTLSKRSIGITAVLRIIKEIAAQTNLLALNAAIEAAQAGDAGRGFAVVAEEIRKLSESSKKSAGEIEELIGGIQNDTSSTAQLITEMGSNIIKGEEATKLSLKAFEEISSGFNDTLEKTQQIVVATNQQSEDLVDVSTIINDIIVIAEETAAGTEETASSSSELSAGMQNHEEKSKQVFAITNELREKVNQFKLK